jgi:hypothetical protein
MLSYNTATIAAPAAAFLFIYLSRAERLKLEKEYLDLQTKAFAAPGTALAEVDNKAANNA